MSGLLSGDIDAAEAMTYNEYAQVLEAVNPDTGELYQPSDFNTISYEEAGVGMLQDAIWADGERLASDEAYQDIAVRFVTASLQGWAYCRDNVQACRDLVVAQGSKLGDSHQLWQMNEINKLIWPAANGVGFIDQAAWDRTAEIAQNTANLDGSTVLTAPPDARRVHERHRDAGAREPAGARRRHDRRELPADRGHAPRGRRLTSAEAGRAGRSTARPNRLVVLTHASIIRTDGDPAAAERRRRPEPDRPPGAVRRARTRAPRPERGEHLRPAAHGRPNPRRLPRLDARATCPGRSRPSSSRSSPATTSEGSPRTRR